MRATADVEEMKGDRFRIVFSAIPYQVSKTSLIERIVELVREGRLPHISDLRDESDRNGMRLVVELKLAHSPKLFSTNFTSTLPCKARLASRCLRW